MKRTLFAIAFLFATTLTAAVQSPSQFLGYKVGADRKLADYNLGFRPQHRGQTHATFPMIFNALYWGRG